MSCIGPIAFLSDVLAAALFRALYALGPPRHVRRRGRRRAGKCARRIRWTADAAGYGSLLFYEKIAVG